VNGFNLKIEYRCPQCGAPVVVEEDDRLLSCDYCRVRLCCVANDYYRYYLEPRRRQPEACSFIPYWRFRGTAYFCEPSKVSHRLIDSSSRAIGAKSFPYSMGLRAQVLKLKPVTPKRKGRYVKPDSGPAQFPPSFTEVPTFPDEEPQYVEPANSAFVGQPASLIYSPVFIRDHTIYDAVSEQPIGPADDAMLEELQEASAQEKRSLRFISALCPHCGWDLDGGKNSVLLTCPHCNSVYQSSPGGLKRVNFEIIPGDKRSPQVHLPFWKLKPRVSGLKVETYADLAKLANLPRLLQVEWAEMDVSFWAPAFRLPPAVYLKTARRITLNKQNSATETDLSGIDLYPGNLPLQSVASWVKISLFDLARGKRRIFPRLDEIKVKLLSFSLVYVPFEVHGNELIEPSVPVRLSRNALARFFPSIK
jgi:DNA-directed RNA polymerase subunit RPC12/RpoP/predicted Zn-ribbon and HTH transcriptional regulator